MKFVFGFEGTLRLRDSAYRISAVCFSFFFTPYKNINKRRIDEHKFDPSNKSLAVSIKKNPRKNRVVYKSMAS